MKKINRKYIAFAAVVAAAAVAFGGCGAKSTADTAGAQTSEAAESEAADTADTAAAAESQDSGSTENEATESEEPFTLKPYPSGFDMEDLKDCQPNVHFTSDDFNWRGGNLTVEVYSELLYDMVGVHNLKVGDSVETGDGTVEVKTIKDTDNGRLINEGEADEILLAPAGGGAYNIMGYDDQPAMADLGEATVILSNNVKLIDCTDQPGETVEVGADTIKQYTEELPEERQTFNPNCTTILIEGREITEIKRVWVP